MTGVATESEPLQPAESSLELVDSVGARIEPDDIALREWFSSYVRQHRARIAGDLTIVERNLPPGARILECGAVPLLTTAALSEMGFELSAVDVAPQRFAGAIADLELDVRRCDLESELLPFTDDSFDAVLFNELFEHLRINPIWTFNEVHRVLLPEGRLFLSTPNLRSYRGIRNLLLRHEGSAASPGIYRQYEKLETLGHMGHVREYTSREVTAFLTEVGFRVEKAIFRGGHGRGLVGLAERLVPSLRPFFALVAVKEERDQ